MKPIDNDLLTVMRDGHMYYEIRVRLAGYEGNDHTFWFDVVSMTYHAMTQEDGSDGLTFSNACSSYIELVVDSPTFPETYTNESLVGARLLIFILYQRVDDEIDTWRFDQRLGYFTVTEEHIEGNRYTYIAYDDMVTKLNKPFTVFGEDELVDINRVQAEVTRITGMTFNEPIYNNPHTLTNFPKNCTCREVVGWIAGLFGGNAFINEWGEIEYKVYNYWWSNNRTMPENIDDLITIPADCVYENEFSKGEKDAFDFLKYAVTTGTDSDGNNIIIESEEYEGGHSVVTAYNPLMKQNFIRDYLYPGGILRRNTNLFAESGEVKSKITPATIKIVGYPIVDPGDVLHVYENETDYIQVYVMSVTHEYDGGLMTTIECNVPTGATEEINYQSPTVSMVEQNRTIVDSQLNTNSTNAIQNKVVAQAIGDIGSILDAINGEVI